MLSQDPAEGTQVDAGSPVNITVSSGLVKVPKVTGSSEAQARSDLAQVGFDVQVVELEDGIGVGRHGPGAVAAGRRAARPRLDRDDHRRDGALADPPTHAVRRSRPRSPTPVPSGSTVFVAVLAAAAASPPAYARVSPTTGARPVGRARPRRGRRTRRASWPA